MFTDYFLIFLGLLAITIFILFIAFILWMYVNYPFLLFVFTIGGLFIFILYNSITSKHKP